MAASPHPAQAAQSQECRYDPAYEARHGILNVVICRICLRTFRNHFSGKGGHLEREHPEQAAEYGFTLYPCAPMVSIDHMTRIANIRRPKTLKQVAQARADRFLSADEFRKCWADPQYEKKQGWPDLVVCRLCGQKVKGRIWHHLTNRHRMKGNAELNIRFQYRELCPGAPIMSLALREKLKEVQPARILALQRKASKRRKPTKRKTHISYISGRETPDGLARAQGDPSLETRQKLPYVICREDGCGEHHENLGPHLDAYHDHLKGFVYQVRHMVDGIVPPLAIHKRKPKNIPKRGRKPGRGPELHRRIELTAAFFKLNWSQRKMSIFVYKDTPRSAYANMRNLVADHRQEIVTRSAGMSFSDAHTVVRKAGVVEINPSILPTVAAK